MSSLVRLDAGQLETVLDETYPIWGEGLTRQAYGQWNRAQTETPWGRRHLTRLGLVDGGQVLASAKRYDLTARVGAQVVPVLGIGAVFTAPALRGLGHARGLINAMLEDAATRGCAGALLFSEIDPAYYQQFGFRIVPLETTTLEVPVTSRGAPAVLVRSAEPRDFEHIAAISARRTNGASFALDRSAEFIAFSVARRRLAVGLGAPALRALEFFVTEEGSRAVAYVVLLHGPHVSWLEDCGDFDPSGARVGAMLQVLSARTPAEAPLTVRAWIPQAFRPSQLHVARVEPATEVMMWKPLAPGMPDRPAGVLYCHLDAF